MCGTACTTWLRQPSRVADDDVAACSSVGTDVGAPHMPAVHENAVKNNRLALLVRVSRSVFHRNDGLLVDAGTGLECDLACHLEHLRGEVGICRGLIRWEVLHRPAAADKASGDWQLALGHSPAGRAVDDVRDGASLGYDADMARVGALRAKRRSQAH